MQFDKDMSGKYSTLFLYIREILLSYEGMSEVKKANITSFFCEGSGICYLRTNETGLTIAMFKGARLEDRYNLFHGNGKIIRHMYMKKKTDIKKSVLKEYIQDAIVYNIEKKERELMTKAYKKEFTCQKEY